MRSILGGLAAALLLGTSAYADTLLVGNKGEHTVSFVNLASGEEVARRETGRAPHEITVSPDGKTGVIVSYREQGYNGNTLHVFDVATAQMVKEISLGEHLGPHGLKWIPGTTRVIATTEVSQDVVIADIPSGAVVGSIETGQQGTHMVALSPDGKTAYSANIASGNFSVLDLTSMKKVQDVKAGNGTEAITVSPDGAEIWVGNNGSRSLMVFGVDDFEMRAEIKTEGIPIRAEFSPDGSVVAVSEADLHRVQIFDAKTHESVAVVSLVDAGAAVPVTLLFSPSGDKLWAAATASQKVVEIDTSDWSITRSLPAGQGSDGLGYSPLEAAP